MFNKKAKLIFKKGVKPGMVNSYWIVGACMLGLIAVLLLLVTIIKIFG